MNVGSLGSAGGMMPQRPSDDQILTRLKKDFGEEAISQVTGENGKIDHTKLREFLKANGVEPPAGRPPAGKPPGGIGGAEEEEEDATDQLLAMLSKEFGEEAAESVKNEDGTVDFEKIKSLIDEKLGTNGALAYGANGKAAAGSSLADFLARKDDDDDKSLLNVTL